MITITLPSKRKSVVEAKTSLDINKELKKLTDNLPYKVGDLAQPYSKKEKDLWGDMVLVETIATSLKELEKDFEWPDDGNPLLVGVYSEKKDCRFFCTTNFLLPLEEVCPC
jgi:hypothetical protein